MAPGVRSAQASNSSFDAATFEIWGALLNGAALIGIPRDILLAPKDFARKLGEERITTLFVTTALFNQMAAQVPEAFQGLSHLLFGGEMVDPSSVRLLVGEVARYVAKNGWTTLRDWPERRRVFAEACEAARAAGRVAEAAS